MDSPRLLAAAVAELGGKTYAGQGVAPGTTNCSRAVGAILLELYGERVRSRWGDLMITDPAQPYSPIDACADLGIGERCSAPIPGRWHVVQGWRKLDARGWVPSNGPLPNGHIFLFWEPPAPTPGPGMLVNANTSRPWLRRLTWGEASGRYAAGVELVALI